MSNFLQRVTSAVKGQFVTVPLDDPEQAENEPSANSQQQGADRQQASSNNNNNNNNSNNNNNNLNNSLKAGAATNLQPTGASNSSPTGVAAAENQPSKKESPAKKMMSMIPKQISGFLGRSTEKGDAKESAALLAVDLESGTAAVTAATVASDGTQTVAAVAESKSGLLSWFTAKTSGGGGAAVANTQSTGNPAVVEAGQGGISSWLNPMSILKTREPNMWDKICPEISRANRWTGFFVLAGMSALFFLLAFFVGLPMVLLAPAKFALSFTVGSLCFMLAFAVLEGPATYFTNNCSRERLPFAASYLVSLVATLYVSFFGLGYILTVITASIQVVALLWYAATYFPGGKSAMKFVMSMGWGAAKSVVALAMQCFNKE